MARPSCAYVGMKQKVRSLVQNLNKDLKKKAPAAKKNAVIPEDLNNQELSKNPLQKLRQLDWQAQKDEERMRS